MQVALWGHRGGRFLSTGAKDLASSGSRAALGTFSCSGWCSGGLPELMLGSPKGILELPGAQFGVSEVRLGASDSVLLSSRRQRKLF